MLLTFFELNVEKKKVLYEREKNVLGIKVEVKDVRIRRRK